MLTLKHAETDLMTAPVADTVARAFSAVCDEGQGLVRLVLLDPDDLNHLLASVRTEHADTETCRVLSIVAHTLNVLDTHCSSGPTAQLCLLCGNQFWRAHPPAVFVVLQAEVVNPQAAWCTGICASCGAKHEDSALHLAAVTGLRARFGIHARLLPPISPPGHA